jgi:DNA-binding GntR family transcriptional regulator
MIHRSPLRDQVYLELLQRIHRGDIPAGARLQDAKLAAEFGVSRTPIREAMLRLARDGVLQTDTGRGFRLRPLDPLELQEVGAILAVLEPVALEQSADFPPARLDRLAEIVRHLERVRSDISRCIDLDDEWHRTLLEGCPNQRLLHLIVTLRQITRRYLHAFLQGAGRVSLSTLYHVKIVESLRQGDRENAARLLQRQWKRGVEELQLSSRGLAGHTGGHS